MFGLRKIISTFVICGLCALGLAACGHTPLASLYKLRNFDPLTTDSDKLRVVVKVSKDHLIEPRKVELKMSVFQPNGSLARQETFSLKYFSRQAQQTLYGALQDRGSHLYGFYIDGRDVARFRKTQNFIKQSKKEGLKGSIAVTAKACRKTASLPPKLPISIFMKDAMSAEFVALLVDYDLLQDASSQGFETFVPVCKPLNN